ncbi:MAG: type I glutamate--ammonia ligase [Chloroflexi bacterium]|nr:type I glutamate--ammonia ligase [Chloroflexota bacterium]
MAQRPKRERYNGRPPTTPAEIIAFCREQGTQMVDVKFVDLPGTLQHFTMPIGELDEKLFVAGTGFDGSSIRGFQTIDESDMLVVPDPATAAVDPVFEVSTISFMCNVVDPITRQQYNRDPRHIAQKAETFLKKSSGIADISYWGPELEFFIFDGVRFDQNVQSAYHFIESEEGIWNAGRDGQDNNLAYRPRHKEGYFPTAPTDTQTDLRSEAVLKMGAFGIQVEKHHHEVATAGQGEIDMRYGSLTKMADQVMAYKYVLKNVARAHNKVATFMPKPLFGDNGTGMHTHQSLWKDGENLFYNPEGYAGLSEMALYYIGGLLKHTPALLAFCAPTTNSYRRLVPGYEAPVNVAYSVRNRSACARIPVYFPHAEAKRIEYRLPDPSCNPYLAFAAMLMAGIDGIVNRIDPGEPMDKDLYSLTPEEAAKIVQCPGSLQEVLQALEEDHEFLLRGDVFTPDVIQTWIKYKREHEVDAVRLRPHPYEFFLYLDA